MATIKTQAGKVVLKGGKASCVCCIACNNLANIPLAYYYDNSVVPRDFTARSRIHRQLTSQELLLYEAGGTHSVTISGSASYEYTTPTTSGSGSLNIQNTTVSAQTDPSQSAAAPVLRFNCNIGLNTNSTLAPNDPFYEITMQTSGSYSHVTGGVTYGGNTVYQNRMRAQNSWQHFPLGIRQTSVPPSILVTGTEFVGPQSWRSIVADMLVDIGSAPVIISVGVNTLRWALDPNLDATDNQALPNTSWNYVEIINGETKDNQIVGVIGVTNSFGPALLVQSDGSASGNISIQFSFTSNAP